MFVISVQRRGRVTVSACLLRVVCRQVARDRVRARLAVAFGGWLA